MMREEFILRVDAVYREREGHPMPGNVRVDFVDRMVGLWTPELPSDVLRACWQVRAEMHEAGGNQAGRREVPEEAGGELVELSTKYEKRYTSERSKAAHLLDPVLSPTDAVCGLWSISPAWWLGTGSQDEYEKAERLPVCKRCAAKA